MVSNVLCVIQGFDVEFLFPSSLRSRFLLLLIRQTWSPRTTSSRGSSTFEGSTRRSRSRAARGTRTRTRAGQGYRTRPPGCSSRPSASEPTPSFTCWRTTAGPTTSRATSWSALSVRCNTAVLVHPPLRSFSSLCLRRSSFISGSSLYLR